MRKSWSTQYKDTVCDINQYVFSPALSFEFYEQHSLDGGEGAHRGRNHFRLDFTKIGRYECQFSDNRYSYRGENEITLLATPLSEEWCLSSSHATHTYHGCALIVWLDKLNAQESKFFEAFGICVPRMIEEMNVKQRWQKIYSQHLVDLFHLIYEAHAQFDQEMILLKSIEMLMYIAKNGKDCVPNCKASGFFTPKQIEKVKAIHGKILRQYAEPVSFERLAKAHRINYAVFNRAFKGIYGDTPYRYLKKIKMNIAAQKLLETNDNILEIAMSVGYANSSKFSSAFKSVMGVLPKNFRNTG